MELIDCLRP
jgi:exocyst complex component 4